MWIYWTIIVEDFKDLGNTIDKYIRDHKDRELFQVVPNVKVGRLDQQSRGSIITEYLVIFRKQQQGVSY